MGCMDFTPEQQKEVDRFIKAFEAEALPHLRTSAMSLTIYTGAFDSKIALEFGAALLLDKPILVMALKGARIPTKMLAVVDEIVEVDDIEAPENKQKLQRGITRLLARIKPT